MAYPSDCIFNPENDLCLANGDVNFVPTASALKFGRYCPGITGLIAGEDDLRSDVHKEGESV
ncbi:MAG: hypothetical protein OSJ55_09715 [Bacteroidales bacterium]|nr:hypothetical protein [Bacteroidales bacterium]